MFGSLLDEGTEVWFSWLPDWAYAEGEKEKIQRDSIRFDEEGYLVLVKIKETDYFRLMD